MNLHYDHEIERAPSSHSVSDFPPIRRSIATVGLAEDTSTSPSVSAWSLPAPVTGRVLEAEAVRGDKRLAPSETSSPTQLLGLRRPFEATTTISSDAVMVEKGLCICRRLCPVLFALIPRFPICPTSASEWALQYCITDHSAGPSHNWAPAGGTKPCSTILFNLNPSQTVDVVPASAS